MELLPLITCLNQIRNKGLHFDFIPKTIVYFIMLHGHVTRICLAVVVYYSQHTTLSPQPTYRHNYIPQQTTHSTYHIPQHTPANIPNITQHTTYNTQAEQHSTNIPPRRHTTNILSLSLQHTTVSQPAPSAFPAPSKTFLPHLFLLSIGSRKGGLFLSKFSHVIECGNLPSLSSTEKIHLSRLCMKRRRAQKMLK